MTSRRRWLIVAIVAALLCALPYAVSRIPAGHSAVPASRLLARIMASAAVPYAGYAEAHGSLALPDSDGFGALAALLGGTTQLRVWWRAPRDWRVDAVSVVGETDVHRDHDGIWAWNYERNRAVRTAFLVAPAARLPRADDLVPSILARRLLAHADSRNVSRLPDARIAGVDAAGLRLAAPRVSTISHVDVWALPGSGLPVKVVAYDRSGDDVLGSTLLDLDTGLPAATTTAFRPPADTSLEFDSVTDIVAAVNRFVSLNPPDDLAGLPKVPRTVSSLGSVGLYGGGVTSLVAIPLPGRLAFDVHQRLASVGTVESDGADTLSVGPLSIRLTPSAINFSRWLLVGTVTQSALAKASAVMPVVPGFSR